MRPFLCTVFFFASTMMLVAQVKEPEAEDPAKHGRATGHGREIDPDRISEHGREVIRNAEEVNEQSRDVLEAARALEDTTHRLKKGKTSLRQIKRDIEQLYYQLYKLDKSLPGKPIVPSPFKKVTLPPVIDFGTSEAKDGGAVILHPKDNDYRPTAKINITNTGGRARYIRITEIEITTPENEVIKVSEVQKRRMYERVYPGKTYSYTFLNPVKIKAIKISISHETNGLKVWTLPVGKIVATPATPFRRPTH